MVDVAQAHVNVVERDPLLERAWSERRDAALDRAAAASFIVSHLIAAGAPVAAITRMSGVAHAAVLSAAGCEEMAAGRALRTAPPLTTDAHSTAMEMAVRQLIVTGCLRASVELADVAAARADATPDVAAMLAPLESELSACVTSSWTVLTTLRTTMSEEVRASVSAHLMDALTDLFRDLLDKPIHWIGTTREQRQLGVPDDTITRAIAVEEVGGTVVPRLEKLGLPALRAWRHAMASR